MAPEDSPYESSAEGDDLPEDLDVTAMVGPYVFPDIRRRRIAATIYVVIAALALWGGFASDNGGLIFGGVLLAVMRLGEDAYGATIRRLIEESTGRQISIGAIYTTLERLQGKGYVTSRVGEPTGERGGRRRKVYELDRLGRLALARAYTSWTNMTRGLKAQLIR